MQNESNNKKQYVEREEETKCCLDWILSIIPSYKTTLFFSPADWPNTDTYKKKTPVVY